MARSTSWLRANLRAPLDVPALARRAGMSVRSLHRHCLQDLDTTPAKLVEKLRVEQARTLLATTDLGTKVIAARCGFRTAPEWPSRSNAPSASVRARIA